MESKQTAAELSRQAAFSADAAELMSVRVMGKTPVACVRTYGVSRMWPTEKK